MYDVIIIGGGPIGLACGIEATQNQLNYLILEKGCLVNSLYHYPMNMTFFSTSERLEIGRIPFVSNNPKPTRAEALEYYRRVTITWNLRINLYEAVLQLTKNSDSFTVETSRGTYESRQVILALGFYDLPYLLHVPGEELPKVMHYYREPHPYFNQDVLVIGAANSAVDAALETWRKGARVTMVVREPALSESVKYWVKPDIENRIKEGSIQAFFQSKVTAIREKEVEILTPEGPRVIANDFVLAMTGYQPPFEFLRKCGVTFHTDEFSTPIYNPETMQTEVAGLYLAGVVCGGLKTNKWFIENSRVHATQIIQAILQRQA